MGESSVFDILDGFRVVEILEQNQYTLVSRWENDEGKEMIVTQTEDRITFKWS